MLSVIVSVSINHGLCALLYSYILKNKEKNRVKQPHKLFIKGIVENCMQSEKIVLQKKLRCDRTN